MNNPLIIANWKMYKTASEAKAFFDVIEVNGAIEDCTLIIAPSATLLPVLATSVSAHPVYLAAQNIYCEDEGAFTGEVSARQVKDAGASYVLIGHSERRQLFGEDDVLVNKKVHAAEQHHLIPILCVGETQEQRDAGKTEEVVRAQLEHGLEGVSDSFQRTVIVAYEPVWAIGTDTSATPEQAQAVHAYIRTLLPDVSAIVYGGSVNGENAAALMRQPNVDGLLVGSASLDPEQYIHIIEEAKKRVV